MKNTFVDLYDDFLNLSPTTQGVCNGPRVGQLDWISVLLANDSLYLVPYSQTNT